MENTVPVVSENISSIFKASKMTEGIAEIKETKIENDAKETDQKKKKTDQFKKPKFFTKRLQLKPIKTNKEEIVEERVNFNLKKFIKFSWKGFLENGKHGRHVNRPENDELGIEDVWIYADVRER